MSLSDKTPKRQPKQVNLKKKHLNDYRQQEATDEILSSIYGITRDEQYGADRRI